MSRVLAWLEQARGGEGGGYKFGDLTRGLLSMGQESLERGRELVEQHSKPIQEGLDRFLDVSSLPGILRGSHWYLPFKSHFK